MEYPVIILSETNDSGIVGSVYHFHGNTKRVYTRSILLYVLKGCGTSSYLGASYQLGEGDIMFIPERRHFKFNAESCHALLCSIPNEALLDAQDRILCISPYQDNTAPYQTLKYLLNEMILTQYQGGRFYRIKLQALWKQCLYSLLNDFCQLDTSFVKTNLAYENISTKNRKEQEFSEILDLLEKSYHERLTLNDVASLYFYSASQLSKLFVKYTGMHFSEYITELRLKHALSLLTQTNLEIGLISDRVGFSNVRTFQQAFKRKYNLSPSAYRADFGAILQEQSFEKIRENIRQLINGGILPHSIFNDRKAHPMLPGLLPVTLDGSDTSIKSGSTAASSVYLGKFSVDTCTDYGLGRKNNILNIYRAKDLLLDTVQENVLFLQKEIGFEYLNCHGFLADDLMIHYIPFYLQGKKQRSESIYDFSIYWKIVAFVRDAGLKMMFSLSYMPFFMARKVSQSNILLSDNPEMPLSMEEWNDFIFQLFTFLYDTFGDWMLECPVSLWHLPDVHIATAEDISNEDYFNLYENTYRTIKKVIPDIIIAAPTVLSTKEGMDFERKLLSFSIKADCIPDMLCVNYIRKRPVQVPTLGQLVECRSFENKLRTCLRSLKLNQRMPIFLSEYFYSMGLDPVNDSMVGAMFPLQIFLENHLFFDSFGYWASCDRTTETVYCGSQFSGGRGLFTIYGNPKPAFYSLKFLSMLGDSCIGLGNGYVITRKENSIQLLLYYDIPEWEWTERFTEDNIQTFYASFPKKEVSLDIDLSGEDYSSEALLCEQFLNPQTGSAYESWAKGGGRLLCDKGYPENVVSSSPIHYTHSEKCSNGILHYEQLLSPFELRFVDIYFDR